MFARTVTRATAMSWIPSLAMPVIRGVVITFGFTETWTASKTSRPAKSMAAAWLNESSMFALSALISALITRSTRPPAR